ncbi:MAG: hypothetical protein ACHBN1_06405 [Heteroscytonema crispum UTEX LB 1556]
MRRLRVNIEKGGREKGKGKREKGKGKRGQPTTRSRFTSRLGRETLPRAPLHQQPTTNS